MTKKSNVQNNSAETDAQKSAQKERMPSVKKGEYGEKEAVTHRQHVWVIAVALLNLQKLILLLKAKGHNKK